MVSRVFFFQAEDGIRDRNVTGVQTCALPILLAGGFLAVSVPHTARKPPASTGVVPAPGSKIGRASGRDSGLSRREDRLHRQAQAVDGGVHVRAARDPAPAQRLSALARGAALV